MKEISVSRLVELLNSGLEGEVMFKGIAFISSSGDEIRYSAKGQFRLEKELISDYTLHGESHDVRVKVDRKGEAWCHIRGFPSNNEVGIPLREGAYLRLEIEPGTVKY